MTQPPYDPRFGADWTVPPPPQVPGQRPVRGRRVAVGIAWATLAHVLAAGLGIASTAAFSGDERAYYGLYAGLIAEIVVFVVCLVLGVVFLAGSRGDKGVGVGLLIGWAVGVIVLPAVGFGICVWLVSGAGTAP